MLITVQEETALIIWDSAPGPCLSHCLTQADRQGLLDSREEGIFSMDELVS